MIILERFFNEEHWQFLWETYNNDAYADFFRRTPVALRKDQVAKDFESITSSKLFIVKSDDVIVGIVCIAGECPFSLSCNIGILIFECFQKQGLLVGIIEKTADYIFNKTNIRKIKVRILKRNLMLNNVVEKYGLIKEGEYKEEILGLDECEYALTKSILQAYKGAS